MKLFQQRLFMLLTTGLIAGACQQQPDPIPTDAQELRLTKKVTAHYYSPASLRIPSQPVQPITYQSVDFYPLNRSQEVYRYDGQKRLTYVETRNPDRPDYTYEWGDVSFDYTGNQLIYTNRRIFPLSPVPYVLNERGYITEYNTYDQNGYLIHRQDGPNATRTQTVEAGNIVKQVVLNTIGRTTTTYEYDLSKAGLPDPTAVLWGRPSRNLLRKSTDVYESFSGVKSVMPERRVTTYTYEFGENGRVRQQTALTESSFTAEPATAVSRDLRISTLEFQ